MFSIESNETSLALYSFASDTMTNMALGVFCKGTNNKASVLLCVCCVGTIKNHLLYNVSYGYNENNCLTVFCIGQNEKALVLDCFASEQAQTYWFYNVLNRVPRTSIVFYIVLHRIP